MSIDYGERERQFLEALKADTGRTLEEWMAAITSQGLTQRNDIIDWLRRQNFMFSKASWLERIHNNGGKPIYAGTGGPRPQARPRNPAGQRLHPPLPPAPEPQSATAPPPPAPTPQPAAVVPLKPSAPVLRLVPTPPPAPPVAAQVAAPSSGQSDPAALDALLARAKAFRPLAAYLIAEIRKAVPDVTVTAHEGWVGLQSTGRTFAVIAISAKELRLGLALKEKPPEAALEPAKLPALRGAPPMSHMAVLNDARQITPSLLAAVAQAADGV
ncbi:DUF5655 domain-containing protein [Hyphomicrobium sp. LHD-15]|uniref:DUF5655 domain-containing protein n=1 Tax=Hyphomicrobium sp. LHD-15 TaxID=3072142 RepID=UPI00280F79E8|nr:DUF5655 domain-containing protein [Hyphomicrobium sp. LHD-15]MDQ8700494.1 DUF5655 domain-containing protein [Hyphomicrobium sp. LHD-15]